MAWDASKSEINIKAQKEEVHCLEHAAFTNNGIENENMFLLSQYDIRNSQEK